MSDHPQPVAHSSPGGDGDTGGMRVRPVRRRRLPSQAEQKRREEWGKLNGPRTGASIRAYIEAAGR